MKSSNRKNMLFIFIFFLLLISNPAYSLNLEEAISLAKEYLPFFKGAALQIKSSEAVFDSSISPYLPSLDATTSHGRLFTSEGEYISRLYDLTLSYTFFDGGVRKANRNIARLNLDISKEDFRKSLLDIEYHVKVAFYTTIAQKETLEHRKIQLYDAERDFEVAEGRYKFGVAKLSDTLQASVRFEQARFKLVQAEGDYKKALSNLNSLIGKPLDTIEELHGSLEITIKDLDINKLYDAALKRPEIRQAKDALEIAGFNKSLTLSSFYPAISLSASYTKTGGELQKSSFSEEKSAALTATWNLFELGKFYTSKSAEFEKKISLENLNDLKRQLLLDVYKTYQDFLTASKNLIVAKQQLEQAEHNYSQALGEYKVGKADILSLVQAESLLADAREQMVKSKLDLMLTKSLLERVAGIEIL